MDEERHAVEVERRATGPGRRRLAPEHPPVEVDEPSTSSVNRAISVTTAGNNLVDRIEAWNATSPSSGAGRAATRPQSEQRSLGAKVVCVEQEAELGGTCLRVGCIPTKAWVQTASALKAAEETFAKLGVDVGAPQLDFGAANEWKNGVSKQMTGGVALLFKANGVEWVRGKGAFKDATTIGVEGGEDVTFTSAIVATGSYPIRPPIPGLDSPAASTRRGSSHRPRSRAGSSSSAAASSAASSPRSFSASAPR